MTCRDLLSAACAMRGAPQDGCFELSVGNPDKGVLPIETVRKRIAQFVEADLPLVITQVCRVCLLHAVPRLWTSPWLASLPMSLCASQVLCFAQAGSVVVCTVAECHDVAGATSSMAEL